MKPLRNVKGIMDIICDEEKIGGGGWQAKVKHNLCLLREIKNFGRTINGGWAGDTLRELNTKVRANRAAGRVD